MKANSRASVETRMRASLMFRVFSFSGGGCAAEDYISCYCYYCYCCYGPARPGWMDKARPFPSEHVMC
jgi:hypothetical protein